VTLAGSQDPVLAARQARAAALEVRSLDDRGRAYRVTGGKAPHQVIADAQGLVCDCHDFKYNRLETCKHIEAVLLYQQQPRVPTEEPTAPPTAADGARAGEIPPGEPPEDDELLEEEERHLELVPEDPSPVQGALSRSGIRPLDPSPEQDSVRPGALHDMAAERAVLSAILHAATVPPAVSGILTRGHFDAEPCGVLYEAALHLTAQGAPVDPITLRAALKGTLDRIGGMELIASLIDEVPSDNHAEAHAQLIVRSARRRQLRTEAERLAQAATDPAIALESLAETAIRTGALGQAMAASALPGTMQQPLVRSLAQLINEPDILKPPAAVMPRLAYRGRVALIVGREKMGGKSTLLTAGAAAVSRGITFLGEPTIAGPVLWVSADQEHAAEITQRAVRFGADPARFHVLWPRESFADLQRALDLVQPILLVVDTLANFARVDDPSSAAEWPATLLPLLRLARERDMAVDVAHHAKKGEGGGYRDSTAIGANVDLLLELRPDTSDPARRHVTVLGRWLSPNFTVELVADHYQLVAGGELSLDAQVLAFIQQHPRCSLRLVRSVGGRAEDVDQALARLLASGSVRNDGSDRRHAYVSATAPAGNQGLPAEETDDLPF